VKLLLDTHILLWSLLEPSRLVKAVASELENPANEFWISPLTTWEILILGAKGRVLLEPDPVTWIRNVYRTIPFQQAPLTHEVAIESEGLDFAHRDPVDCFLGATALVYDLTLVTADRRILRSARVPHLAAR
jgi:PIN domain nuclease of toxin-antitoxin system